MKLGRSKRSGYGPVLDGPIIEPVNIYYFLLYFLFEADNFIRHKCLLYAFGQLLRESGQFECWDGDGGSLRI